MNTPRHLTYDSFEAWAEGEALPSDWTKHPDEAQREVWWTQFAELKQHLWAKHFATLPEETRKEIETRTHPSQSHRFEVRAMPFTIALKDELTRLGYAAKVKVGLYHCDRIVLSVTLDRTPPRGMRDVPWLFQGFEVKYGFPNPE